jgi:hypothetical protein
VSLGLVAWSVFCLGFGLLVTPPEEKNRNSSLAIAHGLAIGMVLWSLVVGVWVIVGMF